MAEKTQPALVQVTSSQSHRCGTVAIVGRPNVGKSTLLNRFLGQKIAIVSPKPETTRNRLLGILTLHNAQILFLDTPGIYRGPKTLLGKFQVAQAREALQEADCLLVMTEAMAGVLEGDRQILKLVPRPKQLVPGTQGTGTAGRPVFLAINKVDRAEKGFILPQIQEFSRLTPLREIFPISALKGDNVEELLKALIVALPQGPALYPADQVTDRPVRELAQELIREKVLLFTHEEVPHAVAVAIEEWRKGKKVGTAQKGTPYEFTEKARVSPLRTSPIYIRATIYVERESQKGILIGKGGSLLKRIGEAARREIEKLVEGKVFLDLWVKVAKNWRKDLKMLKRLGYA